MRSIDPGAVMRPVHRMHPRNATTTAMSFDLVSFSWKRGTDRATTMNGDRYWSTVESESEMRSIDPK